MFNTVRLLSLSVLCTVSLGIVTFPLPSLAQWGDDFGINQEAALRETDIAEANSGKRKCVRVLDEVKQRRRGAIGTRFSALPPQLVQRASGCIFLYEQEQQCRQIVASQPNRYSPMVCLEPWIVYHNTNKVIRQF